MALHQAEQMNDYINMSYLPDKEDLVNLFMDDYCNIPIYFGIEEILQSLGIYIVFMKPNN